MYTHALRTTQYQLVFMDLLMPVMNGVDSVAGMRRARFPHIIAGVTGNVMEEDISEFLDAGACVCVCVCVCWRFRSPHPSPIPPLPAH